MNIIESFVNTLEPAIYPKVSSDAYDLVNSVGVIDLHCDAPLFEKDLTVCRYVGHVDFPRLVEGNVQLQIHAVATQLPFGFNHTMTIERRPDVLTLVYGAMLSRMALMTPYERLLYQAKRMRAMTERSNDAFWVDNRDIQLKGKQTAVVLGFEGAQGVGDKPENIARLYAEGYRIAGLSHFHDNDYCGSHHGETGRGLSDMGHTLVEMAGRLNMIVDLAHASSQTIHDVCHYKKPVLCSHTGITGHYDSTRNISNEDAKLIADVGGVIGIGFWLDAVGSPMVSDIVDGIEYGINVAGVESIALGSDFDGGIRATADTAEMPYLIVDEMLRRRIPTMTIELVVFRNAKRILQENLPT